MRVLITGGGGQVGRELVARLEAERHHDVLAPARAVLDLRDRDSSRAQFRGSDQGGLSRQQTQQLIGLRRLLLGGHPVVLHPAAGGG